MGKPGGFDFEKEDIWHFGIDLHKLNTRNIKCSYRLPHIEDTVDCLNGAALSSALDLKNQDTGR